MVRPTRAEVVCILLRAVSSVRPALPNTQRSVSVCGMDKFTAALMAVARGMLGFGYTYLRSGPTGELRIFGVYLSSRSLSGPVPCIPNNWDTPHGASVL